MLEEKTGKSAWSKRKLRERGTETYKTHKYLTLTYHYNKHTEVSRGATQQTSPLHHTHSIYIGITMRRYHHDSYGHHWERQHYIDEAKEGIKGFKVVDVGV